MRRVLLTAILLTLFCTYLPAQQWDRPMKMKKIDVRVSANAFTATTFIEIEFYNPNEKEIEGLYRFELSSSQVITAFQLDLNGKYRDGTIEEKWKATNAYNTIVGKRIDPALLTMDYANHYSLRIYPVPAKGSRKITMTIQQLLEAEKGQLVYSLPFNVADTVAQAGFHVSVNQSESQPTTRKGLIEKESFVPSAGIYHLEKNTKDAILKAPLSFYLPFTSRAVVCTSTTADKTDFAVRLRTDLLDGYTITPKQLTVLWDASSSAADRDIEREINFLRQFISYHGVSQLTIIPFTTRLNDTAVFYTENGFDSRWQQYLKNITYEGATQLGCIDLTGLKADLFLLFSDGVNSYGKRKPNTGSAMIYAINSSSEADKLALLSIVGTGGGKLINLHTSNMTTAIREASRGYYWLIDISSSSGKAVTEQLLPMRLEEFMLVNGTLQAESDTIFFHYGNNGQVKRTEEVAVANKCETAAVGRVTMLSQFADIFRYYDWSELLDYGLQEKIVTYNTAFIVLERVEDYIRYNIEPPKELEDECRKLNYVKTDTRALRNKAKQSANANTMQNIVAAYNRRISKWDSKEQPLAYNQQEFSKANAVNTPGDGKGDNTTTSRDNNTIRFPGEGEVLTGTEVVVTALGIRRSEKALGYSVTRVDPSTILMRSEPDLLRGLQGKVPGVDIRPSQGTPGSATRIQIRGNSSFGFETQPLIVVDGIPYSNTSLQTSNPVSAGGAYGNSLQNLDPNTIETLTILRGSSAVALYGSRGANGVIVITTKAGSLRYPWYYGRRSGGYYKLKNMEDVDYMQELKELHVSSKWEAYMRLKEEYNSDVVFFFDVAMHFYEKGMEEEAVKVLMDGAEAGRGSFNVIRSIAYLFESWKEYDEAIMLYKQLGSDYPEALLIQRDLAFAYFQQGNYQAAVNLLMTALKMPAGESRIEDIGLKEMMLADMNGIIAIYRNKLDLSGVPASLIKSLPVDLRILVEPSSLNLYGVSVTEPGDVTTSLNGPVTVNGGTMIADYRQYRYTNPVEYVLKNAVKGKYRISVSASDYQAMGKRTIPAIARVIVYRNFGKENQSITVENVIMNYQSGNIEIADLKW